ncbi:Helitron like N domain-containing protein [Aphis craccivora]|uniref:Helitron like N domain-containing protein n=1 Tax=Aphis craccivora TaxID=307492 RepID=A0A6G0VLN6_APHCR|nr:Helitron like N domain-containing protein [Aphis craccivora]
MSVRKSPSFGEISRRVTNKSLSSLYYYRTMPLDISHQRDIIIQSHDNQLQRISELDRSYNALQCPLMFCYREDTR